jgi:hypothetical protein
MKGIQKLRKELEGILLLPILEVGTAFTDGNDH